MRTANLLFSKYNNNNNNNNKSTEAPPNTKCTAKAQIGNSQRNRNVFSFRRKIPVLKPAVRRSFGKLFQMVGP